MKKVLLLTVGLVAGVPSLSAQAASISAGAIEVCGASYWREMQLPSDALVLTPSHAEMDGNEVLVRLPDRGGTLRGVALNPIMADHLEAAVSRERIAIAIVKGKMTVHAVILHGTAGKYSGPPECVPLTVPTRVAAKSITRASASICPAGTRHVGITVKGSDSSAPVVVMPFEGGDYSSSKTVRWDLSGPKAKRTQFVAECNPNEEGFAGVTMRDIPLGVDGCAFAEGQFTCQ